MSSTLVSVTHSYRLLTNMTLLCLRFPICLVRTALIPRLFPNIPMNYLDSGLGPLMGSIACGFSIFIEEKRKRAEMALYVAPRALFAVAESMRPHWLSEGKRSALWAER